MGNIYVACARCNKGMTIAEYNCVFCSDIDNQFVCADCYKKEQPKELMKQIADLEAKLAESEKENVRIRKNWQISKTHQQKLYNNLKQQNKEKGIVNYPITLDGCRIANEDQLLDFAKDFCLEKKYWQKQLAESNELQIATKWKVDDLEKQLAEKEKETSVLKAVIDKNKTGQFGAVNICNSISEFYEPLVKDMIIAELEKLLEKTQTLDVMVQSGHYINQKKVNVVFKDVIDQQIAELKGEK